MRFSRLPGFLLVASLAVFAQDPARDLLRELADAAGPSGFEEPVRKILVDRIKGYATSIRFDGMGSVIATQGSQGPRVMVNAHMDELGGMIRRITPNGYLSMQMLGGWLDQALVDQRWVIIGSKGRYARSQASAIFTWRPRRNDRMFTREIVSSLMLALRMKLKFGQWELSPVIQSSPIRRSWF